MIAVVGLGFIGLTTALGFSHYGYKVFGVDSDCSRLELLKSNQIPFHEPSLKEVLEIQQGKNFFRFSPRRVCMAHSFNPRAAPCLHGALTTRWPPRRPSTARPLPPGHRADPAR